MVDKPHKILALEPIVEAKPESFEDRAARVLSYVERELGMPLYSACSADGSVIFASSDGEVVATLHPDGGVDIIRDGTVERCDISDIPVEDEPESSDEIKLWNDQYLTGQNATNNPLAVDPSTQQNQSAKQFSNTPTYTCESPPVPVEVPKSENSTSREAVNKSEEVVRSGAGPDGVPANASPASATPPSTEVMGVIFPSKAQDSSAIVTSVSCESGANSSGNSSQPAASSSSEKSTSVATGAASAAKDGELAAKAAPSISIVEDGAAVEIDARSQDVRSDPFAAISLSQRESVRSAERAADQSRNSAVSFVNSPERSAQQPSIVHHTGSRAGMKPDPFAAPRRITDSSLPYAGQLQLSMGHGREFDTGFAGTLTNARAGLLTFSFTSPSQYAGAPAADERSQVRVERPFNPQHTRDQGDQGKGGRDQRDDDSHPEEDQ